MPKMKTKSGAKKRFKITGTGKIKFQRANRRHLLSGRKRKAKRQLKNNKVIHDTDHDRIARCFPYGGGI